MIIEHRIENWARWARPRIVIATLQCGSLEGDWRSPQRNHWDFAPAPSRLPTPDAGDAWDVALAVAVLMARYHLVLKLCHVVRVGGRRLDDRTVARLMRRHLRQRILPADVGPAEAMAKVMLGEALLLPLDERRQLAVAMARQLVLEAA